MMQMEETKIEVTVEQRNRIRKMPAAAKLQYIEELLEVLAFYVDTDDTIMTGTCPRTGVPWIIENGEYAVNKNKARALLGLPPEGED